MSLIIDEGGQYSFGTKCHTRNGYAPMYVSLTEDDYNASGQHLVAKGSGSSPNDYMVGIYAMSMFLVDNKDDRGLAYMKEVSSTGRGYFWWLPITLSGGNVSWGTPVGLYIQLSYGNTSSNYVRIIAIRRDTSDLDVFYMYYYTTDIYSPNNVLKKCTIDIGASTYSNSTVISPFIKPLFDNAFPSTPYWASQREVLNDRYWYFPAYRTYEGSNYHQKVYCVDLVNETQSVVYDFTIPSGGPTTNAMFYWGAKWDNLLGLVFSVEGGDWDIAFGYIDSSGDAHVVTRNGGDEEVQTNPFGTMTNISIYTQGYPSQPSGDRYTRYMWVEWHRIIGGETAYLCTISCNVSGVAHSTVETLSIPGGPYDQYAESCNENTPKTWGITDYAAFIPDEEWINIETNAVDSALALPSGYTLEHWIDVQDTIYGYAYAEAIRDSDSARVILAIDASGSLIREIEYDWYRNTSYTSARVKLFGNFLIWIRTESTDYYGHDYTYRHTLDVGAAACVVEYLNNNTGVDVGPSGNIVLMMLEQN